MRGEKKFHLACEICKTCKLLVKFNGRRKLNGERERKMERKDDDSGI